MEDYPHKKSSAGHSYSEQGSNIAFREQTHADREIQNSMLGGSARHKSRTSSQLNLQENPNYARAVRSMHGKAIAGCSRPFPTSIICRGSSHECQNQTFIAESSIQEENIRYLNDSNRESTILKGLNFDSRHKGKQATVVPNTNGIESTLEEISSRIIKSSVDNVPLSSKQHKKTNRRLTSSSDDAPTSSFTHFSSTVHGCSSSDLPLDRRIDTLVKRASVGESSGSRSKVSSASTSRLPLHIGAPVLSLTIPETVTQQQVSRRNRTNRPAIRDDAVSVRTRRSSSGESQLRLSRQGGDRIIPVQESIMIPRLQQIQVTKLEESPTSSSRSITQEFAFNSHHSSGQSQTSHLSFRNRSVPEHGYNRSSTFHVSSVERDVYKRFSMGEVAEVLLALVGIEHDEELTYEQLLMIETSLFHSGLGSHDQHTDMRMDIDNMSYEELLALEEKIGSVSTPLSEEQLSKCLKRNKFAPSSRVTRTKAHRDEDIKCSICQEEYIGGDEVGKLSCKHRYHVGCIQQWLRQKNWCPICKSSALPL